MVIRHPAVTPLFVLCHPLGVIFFPISILEFLVSFGLQGCLQYLQEALLV